MADHSQVSSPSAARGDLTPWSRLRGFNYHPSYATNLIEIWDRFDARTIGMELERGKRHFPGINVLRWWHSWDAFCRAPQRYVKSFEICLRLSAQIGCRVIAVLFNRTHLPPLDFGGIYIDHFLPGSSLNQPGMFNAYLDAVVGGFARDARILAWDLCNEPYWYNYQQTESLYGADQAVVPQAIVDAEDQWLGGLYTYCKGLGATAPLTVGSWGTGHVPLDKVNAVSDVLTLHPYYNICTREDFERQLDADVAFARKVDKPVFVSECCWGHLQDDARAQIARYELGEISRRGLGFLAYVLHHSRMPDSHGPDGGPVGFPQDLSFIARDGRLRQGHELFNEF